MRESCAQRAPCREDSGARRLLHRGLRTCRRQVRQTESTIIKKNMKSLSSHMRDPAAALATGMICNPSERQACAQAKEEVVLLSKYATMSGYVSGNCAGSHKQVFHPSTFRAGGLARSRQKAMQTIAGKTQVRSSWRRSATTGMSQGTGKVRSIPCGQTSCQVALLDSNASPDPARSNMCGTQLAIMDLGRAADVTEHCKPENQRFAPNKRMGGWLRRPRIARKLLDIYFHHSGLWAVSPAALPNYLNTLPELCWRNHQMNSNSVGQQLGRLVAHMGQLQTISSESRGN